MLKNNQIPILGIYSPLDALFHLYSYTKQESCIMLHVASTFSLIMIIKDGEWLFSRILPLGYDNLVYWLADKWKKSFEESEKLFLNLPPGGPDEYSLDSLKNVKISRSQAKLLMQSADEFGNALEGEIRLTLKSIPNNIYEEIKARLPVILSSDLKNQTFLEGILIKKVDYPIISFPYHQTPMAPLAQNQTINFGGVMSQTSHGMNFLKKDLKSFITQKETFKETPFYITMGTGILLLLLSFFIDFYNKIKVIDIAKKKNQEVYKQYFRKTPAPGSDLVSEAEKNVVNLRRKTEVFNIFYRDKSFSEIITEFNKLFPTDTSFDIGGFTYTPKKISFKGKAGKSTVVSQIKEAIEKYPFFDALNCKQRATPSKGGGREWKFRCNLNLISTSKNTGKGKSAK